MTLQEARNEVTKYQINLGIDSWNIALNKMMNATNKTFDQRVATAVLKQHLAMDTRIAVTILNDISELKNEHY
jgi:hypothetical protein